MKIHRHLDLGSKQCSAWTGHHQKQKPNTVGFHTDFSGGTAAAQECGEIRSLIDNTVHKADIAFKALTLTGS